MPYVLWVTAYNTSFLLAYVSIYMALLQPLAGVQAREKGGSRNSGSSRTDGRWSDDSSDGAAAAAAATAAAADGDDKAHTPAVLHALNTHAFAVFLLANLLTGVVNMSMHTMYASSPVALLVLIAYVAACLAVATLAQRRQWRLKL